MSDVSVFSSRYNTFHSTFKETSLDSENNYYLCTDESQTIIDFDKLLECRYPDSNIRPNSFDAIYIDENNIHCIEFKNQKPSKINNQDIRDKLQEGKDELVKVFQEQNIQINDLNFIYSVVYKECKSYKDKYKCGIVQTQIEFGLDKYKDNGFVKEIFTSDVDFFTRAFRLKFKKELTC